MKELFKQKYKDLFNIIEFDEKTFWGFEVGKGWKILLELFFDYLNQLYKSKILERVVIYQVKEKFGSLRIYANFDCVEPNVVDSLQRFLVSLENISEHVCEVCGNTSTAELSISKDRMWFKTLCGKCREEKEFIPAQHLRKPRIEDYEK